MHVSECELYYMYCTYTTYCSRMCRLVLMVACKLSVCRLG